MFAVLFGLIAAAGPGGPEHAFGFTSGVEPLDPGPVPAGLESISAEACGECHRAAYETWSKSRHAVARTNDIFTRGLEQERVRRCVNCHAPVRARQAEGVGCASCHVRAGAILAAKEAPGAPHPVRAVAAFGGSELCAGCHQFNFHELRRGNLSLTDTPIQNTYEEWREYREKGGTQECTGCHFPEGSHAAPGAHDLELLRKAIELQVIDGTEETTFVLAARDAGHDVPTGDVFRRFVLELIPAGEAKVEELARIGRRYESRPDESGVHHMTLVENTSLAPGELRRIVTRREPPFEYRLRYHYERGDEGVSVIVLQGTVEKRKELVRTRVPTGSSRRRSSRPKPEMFVPAVRRNAS